MTDPGVRHVCIDSVVEEMRPPTEDDVPMTSDWDMSLFEVATMLPNGDDLADLLRELARVDPT